MQVSDKHHCHQFDIDTNIIRSRISSPSAPTTESKHASAKNLASFAEASDTFEDPDAKEQVKKRGKVASYVSKIYLPGMFRAMFEYHP